MKEFLNELEYTTWCAASSTDKNQTSYHSVQPLPDVDDTYNGFEKNSDSHDRDYIDALFKLNFANFDQLKSTLLLLTCVLDSLALGLRFMRIRNNNDDTDNNHHTLIYDTDNPDGIIPGNENNTHHIHYDINAVFTTSQSRLLTCIWKNA